MMDFLKMNGAGNDFVIIDAVKNKNALELTSQQISKICNRSNVGCDQFIVLKDSSEADILMEIYNSDGSISGACGNATRCVASILMAEKECDEVNIKTVTGILNAKKEGNLIAVNMGQPKFDWQEIPLLNKKNTEDFVAEGFPQYRFSAVNMGNPHIVTFVDQYLSDETFLRDGKALEIHPLFPQKTNVEFVKIISPNHIKVRVWERGAGETLACGSGACAVAVAAIRANLVPRCKIKISFKGGDLFIDWRQNGDVIMIGGFEKTFSGVFDANFLL
ncbi:MAG: diaminopimelate epimerase [Rickettsiales bacterium]|jgi:diaminopimelate epimerase